MIRLLLIIAVPLGLVAAVQAQVPTAVAAQQTSPPRLDAATGVREVRTDLEAAVFEQWENEAGEPSAIEPVQGSRVVFPAQAIDLQPTIRLRGRIEADATMAVQSAESKATIGDLQNGYGFRRVRLGAQGTITDSTSWVSEAELAGGNVRLRDVFIGLDALPRVRQVRIGHFREPYSLEGMTSSNFITFVERSTANVISPVRNWGVCGYWWPEDERVLYSLGVFRDGTPSSGQSHGDGDNWAFTTRLTGLPVYEPDGDLFRLVHLGGAFSQRVPPNGVINFTPRIGSNLVTVEDNPGSPFLPSVDVAASSYQLYNLQAAGVYGPFSVQAEWSAAAVQQSNAGSIFVHGMYAFASCFLTGEHRGYNRTRGSFDRIDVLRPVIRSANGQRRGLGAVELAGRFGCFDFNSPNLPPDRNGLPAGTTLYELTLGLNWYLNSNTRMMFDYTAGMPDKVGFDPTVAHLFGIRTALFW
jgi:phosphate-selective porin OprO/OprP